MSECFLVHYILNTLPFKISYNTHKHEWSINELMTVCVQEKERLVRELGDSAMLAMQGKDKVLANKKGKGKMPFQTDIKKEPKCHFCKKKGHIKKDYVKFQKWLEKKGNLISRVCYESNILDVGMKNPRKPMGSEESIYSGNKMCSHVDLIGKCTLVLSSGFVLNIEKTFHLPSFSRNLLSVSRLVPLGFQSKFCGTSFNLIYGSDVVGDGTLSIGLFSIE
ncbi:hypothetical protein CDL12_21541 [Handroanthus impetiginosus]|uniref:RNA-directed DNA polymerase n=1 Tax=Handroanthus impetiginosus TaxID=429701 RepID=A0A2G9GKT3_9LAMI|nr:hypothetical protein CDL12_21541 [Handroanthus impetiginosus]